MSISSVPENVQTPPQKGMEFRGCEGPVKPNKNKMYIARNRGLWIYSGTKQYMSLLRILGCAS